MKILLGQSYYLRFDPKLWAAMRPYPPLGTLYAAGVARERGHDVALFDAMLADSEGGWADALDRVAPTVAVIYEDNFNYLSKMCLLRMREAAFTMIEMAAARQCDVIVCGSDATDQPEAYLARGARFVIAGEGEATLAELVDRLDGRTSSSFETIAGLVFRDDATGRVVRTPRRSLVDDLDALPYPAWDLVDVDAYRDRWHERHGSFSMNLVTTRGCPYHCNWCAKPIWGQRYHSRSPENVVSEVTWLARDFRPDHLWFADDILGLTPGWLSRFADLLAARGLRVPFKCLSRADLLLRDGEVEALRRAGCQTVWMGAESGSQRVLDAMEKGVRVEQIGEATRRLKDSGIEVGFFLQFGYPGETRDDIARTFDLVRTCCPDDIGVSVSYPLPGTPFHRRVEASLGSTRNWVDSDDLAMLYRGPFTTAFYRQLHRVLHREFRARKTWRRLRDQDGAWPTRPRIDGRQMLSLLRSVTTLPYARWRLDRLARLPNAGVGPLPYDLPPQSAARPTPQPAHGSDAETTTSHPMAAAGRGR
jgi:radical SAM superfamily enzyme YgiQ (UPF0313 family)